MKMQEFWRLVERNERERIAIEARLRRELQELESELDATDDTDTSGDSTRHPVNED
jgi:hypothetical protein